MSTKKTYPFNGTQLKLNIYSVPTVLGLPTRMWVPTYFITQKNRTIDIRGPSYIHIIYISHWLYITYICVSKNVDHRRGERVHRLPPNSPPFIVYR